MLTLNDGRKELYQWDTGRTATIDIECDVVHFANLKYGESLAVEVKVGKVDIPNKLLMSGEPIYCWAFVKDAGGAYTKKEQTFAVIKRAKPSDYVYTETDVITVKTAVENALEKAKESGDFKGEKGDKGDKGDTGPQGEKGDKGDKGAPGEVTLEYANNTFSNALKGTKSDTAMLLDDVSPVTHEMDVKISSDTVTDLTAVKVSRYGKNLLNEKAVSPIVINEDGLKRYGWNLGILPQGNYALSVYGNYTLLKPISYKTITNGVYSNYVALTDVAKPLTIALNGSQELIVYLFQGITELYDNVTLQLEKGVGTEYEPYIEPTSYQVAADGTVEGVTPIYPTTTLMADTDGVIIDCEYNRDINKAFAALEAAIATNNS